jgi:hypothetical protein
MMAFGCWGTGSAVDTGESHWGFIAHEFATSV